MSNSSVSGEARDFYDRQYQGEQYASYNEPQLHPFFESLAGLLDRYNNEHGAWLEIGCGRGLLQDIVENYTGLDITETVRPLFRKPFVCATAEALPFPDNQFDGAWSYAVLEHVDRPEECLLEMRRVLRTGGLLFLAPAWQCRPWAACDYAWKPYHELSLSDRFRKALIPLRNVLPVRLAMLLPARVVRLLAYWLRRKPTPFRCRRLKPNYNDYKVVDADATQSIDPFEAIMWFTSRGDEVLSHPNWWRALSVRTGALVIRISKP